MNGQGNSVFGMVYEDEFRSLMGKANSEAFASGRASVGTRAKVREYERIHAGWKALSSWAGLDEDSAVSVAGMALADAGLGMMEDVRYKNLAITEACADLVRADKSKAWAKLVAKLGDRSAPGAGSDLFASDRQELCYAEPLSWVGMATKAKAWDCVEAMASLPFARAGLPGFDGQGEPVQLGLPSKEKKVSRIAYEWEPGGEDFLGGFADDGEERDSPAWQEAFAMARRAGQDPILMIWHQEIESEEGFDQRSRAMKTLAACGIVPAWGTRAFNVAAAALALSGSAGALAGCLERGVSAREGLLPCIRGAQRLGVGPMSEGPVGDYPSLAGVAIEPEAAEVGGSAAWDGPATWKSVADWIDKSPGMESSREYEARAAFSLLHLVLERRGWPSAKNPETEARLCSILNWLLTKAELPAEVSAEKRALLSGAAVDAAEAEASSGKVSALREALMAVVHRWSGSAEPISSAAKLRL